MARNGGLGCCARCWRLRWRAAACFPRSRTKRPAGRRSNYTATRHEAMLDGNYTRAIKLFETLEARYPYGRYAQQAMLEGAFANWRAERAGGGHRGVRPLHPHLSQSSERRLRVLPEGPRVFPRGPGTLRLRVRARPVGARSEVDARVVRRVQGARRRSFPESRYAEDAQTRMRYLTNALGMYEVHVARYYYARGAYIAAANRAQTRADQLSADARRTSMRST